MITYHGPRFAAWVRSMRPDPVLSETNARSLRRYAAGIHPDGPQVDAICCELGLHINGIPEEIELPEAPAHIRRLIQRDLDAGYYPHEIARLLELPVALVRRFA